MNAATASHFWHSSFVLPPSFFRCVITLSVAARAFYSFSCKSFSGSFSRPERLDFVVSCGEGAESVCLVVRRLFHLGKVFEFKPILKRCGYPFGELVDGFWHLNTIALENRGNIFPYLSFARNRRRYIGRLEATVGGVLVQSFHIFLTI